MNNQGMLRGTTRREALCAWTTYGLGTENQNLPGFIAMCPGLPPRGHRRRTGRAEARCRVSYPPSQTCTPPAVASAR